MSYIKFQDANNTFTTDDGCINDETNLEILAHVWQEVFHLLDGLPSSIVGDLDAGAIAEQVKCAVEFEMLRRYVSGGN